MYIIIKQFYCKKQTNKKKNIVFIFLFWQLNNATIWLKISEAFAKKSLKITLKETFKFTTSNLLFSLGLFTYIYKVNPTKQPLIWEKFHKNFQFHNYRKCAFNVALWAPE